MSSTPVKSACHAVFLYLFQRGAGTRVNSLEVAGALNIGNNVSSAALCNLTGRGYLKRVSRAERGVVRYEVLPVDPTTLGLVFNKSPKSKRVVHRNPGYHVEDHRSGLPLESNGLEKVGGVTPRQPTKEVLRLIRPPEQQPLPLEQPAAAPVPDAPSLRFLLQRIRDRMIDQALEIEALLGDDLVRAMTDEVLLAEVKRRKL